MSDATCTLFNMQFMNAFDAAMHLLDDKFSFLASPKQIVSCTDEEKKVREYCYTTLFILQVYYFYFFLLQINFSSTFDTLHFQFFDVFKYSIGYCI